MRLIWHTHESTTGCMNLVIKSEILNALALSLFARIISYFLIYWYHDLNRKQKYYSWYVLILWIHDNYKKNLKYLLVFTWKIVLVTKCFWMYSKNKMYASSYKIHFRKLTYNPKFQLKDRFFFFCFL